MYYEEKLEGGRVYYRTTPCGNWHLKAPHTCGEVHEALLHSIGLWVRRANGDAHREDCPLCALNTTASKRVNCEACPIEAYTGKSSCIDTPYYAAMRVDFLPSASKVELEFLRDVEQHYFGPGSAQRVERQIASGRPGRECK